MKESFKQSGAQWDVVLRVIDPVAQSQKRKGIVYQFKGELRSNSVSESINRAIFFAQHSIESWTN